MEQFWETVKDFIVTFGWTKGVFTLFFFLAHFWLFRMYNGRLQDRQEEINRLAADNHEYRDRFLAVIDKHFGLEDGSRLGGLNNSNQPDPIIKGSDTPPKQIGPEPKQVESGTKPKKPSEKGPKKDKR